MTKGYLVNTYVATYSYDIIYYLSPTNALNVNEAMVTVPIFENTLLKIYVKVKQYTLVDAALVPLVTTVTVRKNGVDTALSVSFSAVGTYSATADVDFVDGDELSVSIDAAGTRSAGNCIFAVCFCFLLP